MKTPPPPAVRFRCTAAALALALSISAGLISPGVFAADDPPASPPAQPPAEPTPPAPTPTPTPTPAPAPAPAEGDKPAAPPAPASPEAKDKNLPPAPPQGFPGLDESDPRNEEVEATVILVGGERVTGVLLDDKNRSVTIRIGGIATTFNADQIDQVQKSAPFRERYKLFSESAGHDPEQIIKVADWLAARERYELALYEVERALAVQPANTEAKQRQVRLTKQLELADQARRAKRAPASGPGAGPAATPRKKADGPRDEFPLLTTDQVNIMRVYEVNLHEPPNMVIERATIQRLIDAYAGSPLIPVNREGRDAFFRKPPAEILDIMFSLRAREFYNEVRILETPESLRRFRDDVERTWLTNACATTDCHGGAGAGRLQLNTRRAGSDASVATNLLIVDRFRLADGTPLVDYDRPERSPLLQFALPREDATKKHPLVPVRAGSKADAVKPVFRNPDDRRFQLAVLWMKSMYSPRPDYPITYTPPGQPPAPPVPAPGAAPGGGPGANPGGGASAPVNPGSGAPGTGAAGGGGAGGGTRPEADKSAPSEQPKPR